MSLSSSDQRFLAIHLAFNSIVEDDHVSIAPPISRDYSAEATDDFLSLIESPDAPAHELRLRPGAVCCLMRNLNVKKGLVRNNRVVIVATHSRFVEVRLLDPGHHPTTTYCIPRINFDFQPRFVSYTIRRKQFPLKLAYATTFNSCQGLTFDRVAIDGRCDVFAHGQLYTALSRVRSRNDAIIFVPDDRPDLANVVYRTLLIPSAPPISLIL